MATEQVSTYGTGEQPSIMEVDNSPIQATSTTNSILLPLEEILKSFRIIFKPKLCRKRTGRKNKHNNCSAQGTGVIGSNAIRRNRVNDNCVRVHKKLDLKQSKRPTLFKKKRIRALHYKHAFANRKST